MTSDRESQRGMQRLQSDMDRMLLELTGSSRMYGCTSCGFRPNVDVYYLKSDNALIVKLELPGTDPNEVELQARDRDLLIRGTRHDRRQKEKVYQQMEIGYGTFERRLRMPLEVSIDHATASYENGFLLIRLPVVEPESRKIPIRQKDRPSDEEEGTEESSR